MAPKPKAKVYPLTPSTRGSTRRQLRFTQPEEEDGSEVMGPSARTRAAKKKQAHEEPTGFTPLQMKTLKHLIRGSSGASRVTEPTQPVAQTKIRRQGRTMSVEMMDLTADERRAA
jgi:hypothetical protein